MNALGSRRSEPGAAKALGPQVAMRFFHHHHHVFTIHTGPLTVTAECLTALHAVCRISAALPGFSRFLVNLRVDSAAMSSSERSPSTVQPGDFCCSQTWPLTPNMSRPSRAVFTHTYAHACARAHSHTDTRTHTHSLTHTLHSHGGFTHAERRVQRRMPVRRDLMSLISDLKTELPVVAFTLKYLLPTRLTWIVAQRAVRLF